MLSRYIYSGVILLNEQETSEFWSSLLQELMDYLQPYLIVNKSKWMEQYFELGEIIPADLLYQNF